MAIEERYSVLSNNIICQNSENVQIREGRVVSDRITAKIFLQLKLVNISHYPVRECTVNIILPDKSSITHTYKNCTATTNEVFGVTEGILLPQLTDGDIFVGFVDVILDKGKPLYSNEEIDLIKEPTNKVVSHTSNGTSMAVERMHRRKFWWKLAVGTIVILSIIVMLLSECRFSKPYDGKCDICGKTSDWKLDGHEYCDLHAGEKMMDDFNDHER